MSEDLRRRLARFDRSPRPKAPAVRADLEPLGALLDHGAEWSGQPPSGFLRIERELEAPGGVSSLRALAPDLPHGDVLVLDTETTGLESGTGTLVFVVGLVRWSAAGQRLVQLFLPEPAGEQAFLSAVAAELSDAVGLVSYNGRGFDLPRLRSRMRIQRVDESGLDLPHVDLLYPTRRLVRGWLPNARLKTVEERFLGLSRTGDLPGEFAPEVYRNLQLEHRDTGIVDVVRHNALDVERLPMLARRLSRVLQDGNVSGLPGSCILELARFRLDRGDRKGARNALALAIEDDDTAVRGEARAMLARMLRRAGDFDAAAVCWDQQLAERPGDLLARVELAKLLEHRLHDRERALALVAEARTLLSLRPDLDPTLSDELDHRYRRLVRRIGRRS